MRFSRAMLSAGAIAGAAGCGPQHATITLDPATRFQTIVGWEAHHQSGATEPGFAAFRDSLFDLAVNMIGINRVRIEAWSGIEQPIDRYAEFRRGGMLSDEWRCHRWRTINDNADPDSIDWSGFHFTQLDEAIERTVLPLRRRLEARGERLYVNVTYDSFVRQCPGVEYIHDDVGEYAEFALATFVHIRDRFGFVPDAWEMILEPDKSDWTGRAIGEAMVRTGDLLAQHGFTPDFIAPSSANLHRAIRDFDAMIEVPRVREFVRELSYHRYGGVSSAGLREIAERGARYGLRTAMLEHIGSGYEDLHADLALANASAWQQFALAYRTKDNGAQYIVIGDDGLRLGERTRFLAQYFQHVRAGATRISAASTSARADPVAFVNSDGRTVVVVKTDRAAVLRFERLPPGRYVISWTTAAESTRNAATGVGANGVLVDEGVLVAGIPAKGVITIVAQ